MIKEEELAALHTYDSEYIALEHFTKRIYQVTIPVAVMTLVFGIALKWIDLIAIAVLSGLLLCFRAFIRIIASYLIRISKLIQRKTHRDYTSTFRN